MFKLFQYLNVLKFIGI